jgi:preprotein translocase subunit SecA
MALVNANIPSANTEEWDLETLIADMNAIVHLPEEFTPENLAEQSPQEIHDALTAFAEDAYEDKEESIGSDLMRQLERLVMLRSIDALWVEHLTAMDEMRQGIGLQAYGQQDPLVIYKREARDMWDQLLGNISNQIVRSIYHVEIAQRPQPVAPPVTVATQPGVAEESNGSVAGRPAHAASGRLGGGGEGAAEEPAHEPADGRRGRPDGRDGAEGRPQRAVPVREWQEVQEVPRG